MVDYDVWGEPRKYPGKHRPKYPKTFDCECGKLVERLQYNLYCCYACNTAYKYRFGELVKGVRITNPVYGTYKVTECIRFPFFHGDPLKYSQY